MQEIVVLHGTRIAAEILRRTTEGDWPEQLEQRQTGELMFASIGLRLSFAELYARPGLTERKAVLF